MNNQLLLFFQQFRRLSNKRFLSRWIILLMDLFIMVGSTCFAYWFLFFLRDFPVQAEYFFYLSVQSFVSSVIAIFSFRIYRHIIRHSRVKDLWKIAGSVMLKTVLLYLLILMTGKSPFFSDKQILSFILFDGMLTFISIINIRLLMLILYEALQKMQGESLQRENILCYGINDPSIALKMRLSQSTHYRIAGFCVYGKRYNSYQVASTPVYNFEDRNDIVNLVREKCISSILFATQEDVLEERERLIRFCEQNKVKTLIAPSINEINDEKPTMQTVRNIRIEDLLGREEIKLDNKELITGFSGKTVLVTGAAGSIGRELTLQLATLGVKKLLVFDVAETPLHSLRLELSSQYPDLDFVPIIGDVRSQIRMDMVFRNYHPEVVLHAAAYKHVPLMEENPCEAVLVNVIGTRNVADMAVRYKTEKMIMVSTDKAVNPTNVMGASKRLAEMYVQSLGYALRKGIVKGKTTFVTTRFGNVLGSNGSVIPLFKKQIEEGGPLTVTHPSIIRYFMTIPEACRLVLEAALMGEGGEIYVFKMGDPIRITDLATRMIELAGFTPGKDMHIIYTGLRPGEKLYEELLSTKENSISTHHEKISIAKVHRYDYNDLINDYNLLEKFARSVSIEATILLMKELIPEFISRNSIYEKLDEQRKLENENSSGLNKAI